MRAHWITQAIKNCLLSYEKDGGHPFQDAVGTGVVEAGERGDMHSHATVSMGFDPAEFPAVQIVCDVGPGTQEGYTTNETEITREVLIQVVTRDLDKFNAIEAAEDIRQAAWDILKNQLTFQDGDGLQRDLLSQKIGALGGFPMIVKECIPLPYKEFQVDKKWWYAPLGLQVTVYYIEALTGDAMAYFSNVDAYYRQDFFNALIVSVPHGLGKIPTVLVRDNNNNVIFCDVDHLDENNLKLTFSKAITGTVVCN